MKITVTAKVTRNDFGKLAAGADVKARRYVAKATLDMQALAQDRARVDTGNMKGSIQSESHGPYLNVVYIGAAYGAHHEYGTVRMSAQPMIRPAADIVRPQFVRAIQGLFKL